MHDPALYPEYWRRKSYREGVLAAADNRCQAIMPDGTRCPATQRSSAQSRKTGEPYTVHLAICHKFQYQTWDIDADTIVLCQAHHLDFDKEHHRLKERFHTPIGYAKVYIVQGKVRRPCGFPVTFAKLRAIIDSQPVGTLFEVVLQMDVMRVGFGKYLKTDDGIHVRRETGAAKGLHLSFPAQTVRSGAFIFSAHTCAV